MKGQGIAIAAAVLLGMGGALAAESSVVLPVGQSVGGLTQLQYTERWWQWANRVQPGVRPYQDPTGAQCALNQDGPVWLLAGTDGTAHIERNCTLPAGKHLFLPVIHMLAHASPAQRLTCDRVKAEAATNNERLAEVSVEIDGVSIDGVRGHRLRGGNCFNAFPSATYLDNPSLYYPAATDGYWLMLRPLPVGIHDIVVHARYDNPGSKRGDMEQVFRYRLDVRPPRPEPHDPTGTILARR